MLGVATERAAISDDLYMTTMYQADAARFATSLLPLYTEFGKDALANACERSCACCDCASFKGVAVRELDRLVKSTY
eukprot:m.82576 g.82576  ORF g.82576 m.82576 type:complete len:77 (-) comp11115_c0_seq1:33-263(-)